MYLIVGVNTKDFNVDIDYAESKEEAFVIAVQNCNKYVNSLLREKGEPETFDIEKPKTYERAFRNFGFVPLISERIIKISSSVFWAIKENKTRKIATETKYGKITAEKTGDPGLYDGIALSYEDNDSPYIYDFAVGEVISEDAHGDEETIALHSWVRNGRFFEDPETRKVKRKDILNELTSPGQLNGIF